MNEETAVKTSGFFGLYSFSMSNVSNYFALRSMQLLFQVFARKYSTPISEKTEIKEKFWKRVQKHTFSAARHKNEKSNGNEHSHFSENEFSNIYVKSITDYHEERR